MSRMGRSGLALLAGLLASSCADAAPEKLVGHDGTEARYNGVSHVTVCCPATVYQGVSYDVHATVYDTNGAPMHNPSVWWYTDGNGVAAISGSSWAALVQAVGVGQTTIYANVNGVVGTTTLTVLPAPVASSIEIVGAPVSVQMGHTRGLTARVRDQYGNVMSNVSVSWSVQNTSIATVSSTGTVTPVSVGTTSVTATAAGLSTTAQLSVTPALSVTVSGPSMIWSPGYYTWSATPSGGNGSFTYEWWIDFAFGSHSQQLSLGNQTGYYVDENTGPFAIRVIVRSAGSTAEEGQMVCNFIAGAHC